MQTFFEIILLITGFISIIPVIKINKNRNDKKYTCLKVLIYATFFWTILILLERISSSRAIIYYSGMLGFPLKMTFASLMLCTIFQYVELKMPKVLKFGLFTLIIIDSVIALTNSYTLWFLNLSYSNLISFNQLYQVSHGPLFIYHLVISYVIAVSAIGLLFVFLAKHRGVRQYKEITVTMALSVAAVLVINLLQALLFIADINLTYVSLVLVAYILYDVIYKKDMIFNLRTSGRSEILANMREMYILTDVDKKIIEISPLLIDKYDLIYDDVIGKPFDDIVKEIEDRVTLYTEYDMSEEDYENKDHYHLREKTFQLKGMNETGHMILLYDETQVYYLLRELNRLGNYDALTGLNNRNYIESKLNHMNDFKQMGVFSIDINGLKINNDYLGHERGDYLLKQLGKILKHTFKDVQQKDIARIGGDEFLVIVKGLNLKQLDQKKIELIESCLHEDIEKTISISVGLAYNDYEEENIFHLIQKADVNMYHMKEELSKAYQEKMIKYIKLQDKFIR